MIKEPTCKGKCVIAIQFQNKYEYKKWKMYVDPNRKWDFDVVYPAIMRTEFDFHNSLEAEMLAKKIIQLLEMGFSVYTTKWELNKNY